MNLKEIVNGCIKGDRRSQNELYKKYYPLMYNISIRYSNRNDDVMHLINSGFFKVLKNIESFNDNYSIATWIRKIMIRNCIDEFRKSNRLKSYVFVNAEQEYPIKVDQNNGELNLAREDLLEILQQLPEMQRSAFNLFAIDGFKHNEVSEMLDISPGLSRWYVNDARKRVKTILEQYKKLEEQSLNKIS